MTDSKINQINRGLETLLQIMKDNHDSKTDLARFLGTSRQNVSQVFRGDQYFTVSQIRLIAARYNMTAEQVCTCFALL